MSARAPHARMPVHAMTRSTGTAVTAGLASLGDSVKPVSIQGSLTVLIECGSNKIHLCHNGTE
jgi:hypothetical protein